MRVVNRRGYFLDWLNELVGIKAGIAVGEARLTAILKDGFAIKNEKALILGGPSRWWHGDPDETVAIRAEEMEFDFLLVMHHVGALPDLRSSTEIMIDFVRDNAEKLADLKDEDLARLLTEGDDPNLGQLRREIARRSIMNQNYPEGRDWDGLIPLDHLFDSEEIPAGTSPETYFDQRFIDYLQAQPQDLASIHWRQFEYLTGEYFKRNGYRVWVGPGRGDGGVDVWILRQPSSIGPDLIAVQCRRYATDNPVEIDAIKAFWATANDAGVTRGLIATTSRFRAGARSYCDARRYRLTPVEGEAVRKWITQMATT